MTERELFIVMLDDVCIKPSNAIIMLEGDGFSRCETVISLYKHNLSNKVYFSGGITDYTYGSIPFPEIKPRLIEGGIPESSLYHESVSQNTREQAVEIVSLARKNAWSNIILVASHYHIYRAFLTFLKVVLDCYPELIIYPAPCIGLPWHVETGWGKRIDLIDGEFDRIDKYLQLNHVATYCEGIEYLRWIETN